MVLAQVLEQRVAVSATRPRHASGRAGCGCARSPAGNRPRPSRRNSRRAPGGWACRSSRENGRWPRSSRAPGNDARSTARSGCCCRLPVRGTTLAPACQVCAAGDFQSASVIQRAAAVLPLATGRWPLTGAPSAALCGKRPGRSSRSPRSPCPAFPRGRARRRCDGIARTGRRRRFGCRLRAATREQGRALCQNEQRPTKSTRSLVQHVGYVVQVEHTRFGGAGEAWCMTMRQPVGPL